MASTQSQYVVPRDFTSNTLGAAFLLPYYPNSMVISLDGSTIYMGSSSGLMVLSAINTLALTRQDITSPGIVLGVSPDGNTVVLTDPVRQTITLENNTGGVITTFGGVGTHAVWAPDGQTLYITTGTVTTPANGTTPAVIAPSNQVLVYSNFTGWTQVTNSVPALDATVTVPSVGAYFAGSTTTARGYCAISTPTTTNGVTSMTNVFYPPADMAAVPTDRIAATNNGLHILGATVTPPRPPKTILNDLLVTIPIQQLPAAARVSVGDYYHSQPRADVLKCTLDHGADSSDGDLDHGSHSYVGLGPRLRHLHRLGWRPASLCTRGEWAGHNDLREALRNRDGAHHRCRKRRQHGVLRQHLGRQPGPHHHPHSAGGFVHAGSEPAGRQRRNRAGEHDGAEASQDHLDNKSEIPMALCQAASSLDRGLSRVRRGVLSGCYGRWRRALR